MSVVSRSPAEPGMPAALNREAAAPVRGRWRDNRWQPDARRGKTRASRRRIRAPMSGYPRLSNLHQRGCRPNVWRRRWEVASPGNGDRNPHCEHDEHHPVEQIVDSVIVDAATGDHRIANAGDLRDLGWDLNARICAPIPGAENLIDPPALPFILNVCDEYGGGQDAHPIFVYPWRRSVADRR